MLLKKLRVINLNWKISKKLSSLFWNGAKDLVKGSKSKRWLGIKTAKDWRKTNNNGNINKNIEVCYSASPATGKIYLPNSYCTYWTRLRFTQSSLTAWWSICYPCNAFGNLMEIKISAHSCFFFLLKEHMKNEGETIYLLIDKYRGNLFYVRGV